MVYDVVIIGAGTIGISTGYYLSKKGQRVLMIDAHKPPHEQGSHGGETRLIRHAYGEGRAYTPLARHAQKLWNDLQAKTDDTIFKQTGILSIAQKDSHFLNEIRKSAQAYHLPLKDMDRDDLKAAYPSIELPDDSYGGCFEPESGVVFVDQALSLYLDLAIQNGAELQANTIVESIKQTEKELFIQTDQGNIQTKQVLISTGAHQAEWFRELNLNIELTPKRQVIGWFESDPSFDASTFPGFTFESEQGTFYGFPSFDGSGVKLGRHDYGTPVDPDHFDRDFTSRPEDEQMLREFLKTFMPKAAGKLNKGKTCLYTMSPDEDFIIDQHPEDKRIHFAAGFSGHGFKFASALGEALADRLTDQPTQVDLAMFKMDRFRG
ncbi:N-methyl-L-tryptophan oxidase [Pelagirhabdus alkalitolerans]|uniref:N-methyl-L-tryptophan oxidase n=1 Tax=Pelagirhabdus alkalitolerans TaxID=1612202 RepID=A0A1G6JV95_9BACI|nr:N-methyl-L-tryptophan oxidase [Pelagirhabdus alkalitolerans]SDC22588.1 N-methyl-L-tryptophan oxidase [Pelagirhabdus alkalitolerans]